MKTITVSFCQDEGETEIYKCKPVHIRKGHQDEVTYCGIRGELECILTGDCGKSKIPIEFDSIKIQFNKEDESGYNSIIHDKIAKCITEAFKVKK